MFLILLNITYERVVPTLRDVEVVSCVCLELRVAAVVLHQEPAELRHLLRPVSLPDEHSPRILPTPP